MTHPFDNPLYTVRPGDRFVQTKAGKRCLVEIGAKRFNTGDREGATAQDIQIIYLGKCNRAGRVIEPFEPPMDFRVPHGRVLFPEWRKLPVKLSRGSSRPDCPTGEAGATNLSTDNHRRVA